MRRTFAGVLAACGALILAAPMRAQDRPDLLEASAGSVAKNRTDGVDYIDVQLTDTSISGGIAANHRQSVRVSHEFPGADSLLFRIYEPDKVTRSATLYKTQQKDYLFARIFLAAPPTPYTSFSAYGVVTGCTGNAQVKAPASPPNQLKYKFGCKSAEAVMDQLAVPAPLRASITGLFGNKFAFSNTADLP
jgi:hypothetical protein